MAPPKVPVDSLAIRELIRSGKKWTEISAMLGCSVSTAKRRLRQNYLVNPLCGKNKGEIALRGSRLDALILDAGHRYPTWGRQMLQGYLRSEAGIHVPLHQIQKSIKRAHPNLASQRVRRRLRRRTYFASRSMQVLHIDGNAKLAQWKFMLHGAIDGYSRRILYLDCHSDNKSCTVYASFKQAVMVYGLPTCVRSDKGGENVLVCEAMLYLSGRESSFKTGRSVHNQRIERFWVDCNQAMMPVKQEFLRLELDDLLDRQSDIDLFTLHLVYKRVIDARLETFVQAYNAHKISSLNASPDELFFSSYGLGAVHSFTEDDFSQFENNPSVSYNRLTASGHQGILEICLRVPDAYEGCKEDIECVLELHRSSAVSSVEAYGAIRALLRANSA